MHALSLEPLTLPDVHARELIEIAARIGFPYVGMVLNEPDASLPVDPIVKDADLRRETKARMQELGVQLNTLECFNLRPDADVAGFAEALACGAELGARTASTIVWENSDRADVLSKLQRLADMAKEVNIKICLEFFAACKSLNSMEAAIQLAQDSGRDNVAVVMDLLHIMRTGGSIDALRQVPPHLIGSAQIADGPLQMDDANLLSEAGGNRMTPGEGEFPLRAFADAIPADVIIGVEVPQVALIGKVSPDARADVLAGAIRRVLQ